MKIQTLAFPPTMPVNGESMWKLSSISQRSWWLPCSEGVGGLVRKKQLNCRQLACHRVSIFQKIPENIAAEWTIDMHRWRPSLKPPVTPQKHAPIDVASCHSIVYETFTPNLFHYLIIYNYPPVIKHYNWISSMYGWFSQRTKPPWLVRGLFWLLVSNSVNMIKWNPVNNHPLYPNFITLLHDFPILFMAQNPGTGGCLFQLGGPMSCMPMIWPLRASTTRIKKQCISWGFRWISPRKTQCFGLQTIETGLNQEKFEPKKTTLEDVDVWSSTDFRFHPEKRPDLTIVHMLFLAH